MTAAERTAALSRLIHNEYLTLGGLSDIPACDECVALSGLLTGLVRLARQGGSPETIEALVAECAETLGLVEREPVEPDPEPATSESMADHITLTRVSLLGTAR